MSEVVTARGIGKRYFPQRGAGQQPGRFWTRRPTLGLRRGRELWALRDVSFTVRAGESVGIIGPNGGGKTTILRILSGVTRPTTGALSVHGRAAALIELGAGFHPELTGRENILMYGLLLGLRRHQIAARFDDIVRFAELSDFVDVPVKRYSAGMTVRLAFSVAAHVNPDLMLLDEVLAVGDVHFQHRCLEWAHQFTRSQRTFVVVSHQLNQIESTCQRVLYVRGGRLVYDGAPDRAISLFLGDGANDADGPKGTAAPGEKTRVGPLDVPRVRLLGGDGEPAETVTLGTPLTVAVDYLAPEPVASPKIEIAVRRGGLTVGQANTLSSAAAPHPLAGHGCVKLHWPACLLAPQAYSLDVFVSDGRTGADLVIWRQAATFRVVAPPGYRLGSGDPGMVVIPGSWSFAGE